MQMNIQNYEKKNRRRQQNENPPFAQCKAINKDLMRI